jgi:hypothetical protein
MPPVRRRRERRRSKRIPIALDVVIYYKGLPIAVATSRNISLDGMYVETRWHLFSRGTVLDAEFILDDNRDNRRHRVSVVVTHVRGHEFGLMFKTLDQRLSRALELTLYGDEKRSDRRQMD